MKFANAAVAATLAISLLVAGMSATAAECPDEEGAQLGSDSVATLEPEESAEAIPEPVAETLDYPEETSEQILEEMLGDELGAGEVEYVDAAALEADAGTANAFGTELLSVLNAERAKYSLQPLKLTVAAQAYTQTYTQTWTSRYSTCGKSSLAGCHMDTLLGGGSTTYRAQELKKQGWRNGGDLLARGFSSEEAVARAWLNSDAHRKWIMDGYGAMTAVGLGKVSTTTTSGHITTTTNTWTLWIVGSPMTDPAPNMREGGKTPTPTAPTPTPPAPTTPTPTPKEPSSQEPGGVASAAIERLAGTCRYTTNLALDQKKMKPNTPVFIATGANFPDGLSAAAAGGAVNATVLLVNGASAPSLSAAQTSALSRSKTKTVNLVGGTGVVNARLEANIRAKGYSTSRLFGSNRHATNAAVTDT